MSADAEAVYFKPEDYASVPRRLMAFLIDVLFVAVLCYAAAIVVVSMTVSKDVLESSSDEEKKAIVRQSLGLLLLCWVGLAAVYHIAVRRARGGTLGYRLAGIRMVNAFGEPPSLSALIKRFLIATPTCTFFALSYLSCRNHPKRQAIHDQFAGTWLVRRSADPAGPAELSELPHLYGIYPFALMLTNLDVSPPGDAENDKKSALDGLR
ncbi:MAG: RDD family protein [Phycisphaerales bacterium]|nr:RDD family protein [Phycisphaerales bacterium]